MAEMEGAMGDKTGCVTFQGLDIADGDTYAARQV